MTGEPLEIGQEVRVYPLHGGGDDVPAAGWPATVQSVGDELATAAVFHPGGTRPVTFSVRDFRSIDSGAQYFITTVEWAQMRARQSAARAVLAASGITVEPGSCLSVEQIEALAEVARTFESEV